MKSVKLKSGDKGTGETVLTSQASPVLSSTKNVVIPGSSVMARRSANIQKANDGSLIYKRRQSLPASASAATPDAKGELDAVQKKSQVKESSRSRMSLPTDKRSDRKRPAESDISPALSLPKRRRTIRNTADGTCVESDAFCWICHRDGQGICCELCPRIYHIKCLGIEAPTGEWVCPECERVMVADNLESRSKAMATISIDTLCTLLRFVLQRMKYSETDAFQRPVDSALIPTYTDYIFNAMDFSTLEKNIKKKMYGSTEAFVADVKWILHNCIVFNGKKHRLTNIAKTILKICRHETNEIEVCPDCYMNSCTKPSDNWFCEPCRTPHPLVWAKMKGYPFWPAKVLRSENGQVDVRFFGEHDRAWVPVSQIFRMSEEPPTSLKNRKGFEQATEELRRHIELLREKFGSFTYATHRTPYDPSNPYSKVNLSATPSKRRPVFKSKRKIGKSKRIGKVRIQDESKGVKIFITKISEKSTSIATKTASAVRLKYNSIISTRMASAKKADLAAQEVSSKPTVAVGCSTSYQLKKKNKKGLQKIQVLEDVGCSSDVIRDDPKSDATKVDMKEEDGQIMMPSPCETDKKEDGQIVMPSPCETDMKEDGQIVMPSPCETDMKEDGQIVMPSSCETDMKEDGQIVMPSPCETAMEEPIDNSGSAVSTGETPVTVNGVDTLKSAETEQVPDLDLSTAAEQVPEKSAIEESGAEFIDIANQSPSSEVVPAVGTTSESQEGYENMDSVDVQSFQEQVREEDNSTECVVAEQTKAIDHMEDKCLGDLSMNRSNCSEKDSESDLIPNLLEYCDSTETEHEKNREVDQTIVSGSGDTGNSPVSYEGPKGDDTSADDNKDLPVSASSSAVGVCGEHVEEINKCSHLPITSEPESMDTLNSSTQNDISKGSSEMFGENSDASEFVVARGIASGGESSTGNIILAENPLPDKANDIKTSSANPITGSNGTLHLADDSEQSDELEPDTEHTALVKDVSVSLPTPVHESSGSDSAENTAVCKLSGEGEESAVVGLSLKQRQLDQGLDSFPVAEVVTTKAEGVMIDKSPAVSSSMITSNTIRESTCLKPSAARSMTESVTNREPENVHPLSSQCDDDLLLEVECEDESVVIIDDDPEDSNEITATMKIKNVKSLQKTRRFLEMTKPRGLENAKVLEQRLSSNSDTNIQVQSAVNQPMPRLKSPLIVSSSSSKSSSSSGNIAGLLRNHRDAVLSPGTTVFPNKVISGVSVIQPVALGLDSPTTAGTSSPIVDANSSSAGASSASPSLFEFNIAGFDYSKYSNKMIDAMTNMLKEFCQDMVNAEAGSAIRKHMQLELNRLEWKHEQELIEIRHNAALQLAEMRLALEHEKEISLAEIKQQMEVDKKKEIEEVKKKQWCANCGKEAIFYCCWNTSYCNYPCQQAHWPRHMHSCTQSPETSQSHDTSEERTNTAPANQLQKRKDSSNMDLSINAALKQHEWDKQQLHLTYATPTAGHQYFSNQPHTTPNVQMLTTHTHPLNQQQTPSVVQVQYSATMPYNSSVHMTPYLSNLQQGGTMIHPQQQQQSVRLRSIQHQQPGIIMYPGVSNAVLGSTTHRVNQALPGHRGSSQYQPKNF